MALSPLNELFVQAWEEEAVPNEWCQGIMIPLYKGKGLRSEFSNYRGTGNKSITSKAMQYRQYVGSLYQEGC